MAAGNYEVVFNGMIARGSDLEQVKQNLAALFKTDVSKMEALFSGGMVVVKSGIDQESANRYQAAMKKAGAVCAIREKSVEAAKPRPSESVPVASEVKQPAPVSEIPVAPDSADEGMLAPPGVQIIEYEVIPEPHIDISTLNMADVGADVTDPVAPPPSLDINIDNLHMADVGADVTDPVAPPPPLDINIDNLGMAEVGALVVDPVVPPPPLDVSIDNMSLAEAGADVTDKVASVPEPDIDISKLKFADEG
ncbi:MAG: hypothetical protein OEX83_09360 [Gammaproteobacteria bacterium]|nr:hypothetical protein [Gammaproteobacteria bacterium]